MRVGRRSRRRAERLVPFEAVIGWPHPERRLPVWSRHSPSQIERQQWVDFRPYVERLIAVAQ